MKSNLIWLSIVVIILTAIAISIIENHKLSQEDRGYIIRGSLELLFDMRNHPLPANHAAIIQNEEICIRDSILLKNNLPELQGVKFVFLNAASITDSVLKRGVFNYYQILKMDDEKDTVVITWRKESGVYSHKLSKIIY